MKMKFIVKLSYIKLMKMEMIYEMCWLKVNCIDIIKRNICFFCWIMVVCLRRLNNGEVFVIIEEVIIRLLDW